MIRILLLLALVLGASAQTTTSTPFTSAQTGPSVQILAGGAGIMNGAYSITGTFVATLAWQYSTDNQNWFTLATYTAPVAATNFTNPGFYRWNCTAFTSGTATGVQVVNPYIWTQIISHGGQLLFQVDDSGCTVLPSTGGGGGGSVTSTSAYSTTVGDGATTVWTISHPLNSTLITTDVIDTGSGMKLVPIDSQIMGPSTVQLVFDHAPTLNQYNVLIRAH